MTRGRARLLAVAVVAALTASPAAPAVAQAASARDAILRAAEAGRTRPYAGEALSITWEGGRARVLTFDVASKAPGDLTVRAPDDFAMRLGASGGGLVDYRRGWFVPLPASDTIGYVEAFQAMERKYMVRGTGRERLLNRPSRKVEISRRADGRLRERLWLDTKTGLLLRRESYDGAQRMLRLATYLSLDLQPEVVERATHPRPRAAVPQVSVREQGVAEVDLRGLDVLRDTGWTVPEFLPGGYRCDAGYAVSSTDSQPLQLVYTDGLYKVSLFQQPGSPDWDSLPPGAQPVAELGGRVFSWPGALPSRLVWEADGRTYSLVGDAPPDEFLLIARALPGPASYNLGERLQRGLGKLWSILSPWS